MSRFATVLEDAVAAIRATIGPRWADRDVVLVRGISGTVQVLVGADATSDAKQDATDATSLKTALVAALGRYFAGDVWVPSRASDPVHAALMARASPERVDFEPGEGKIAGDPTWFKLERHVSKSAWTARTSRQPWPLVGTNPPIIAFYSFKGGVGRTTAVAVVAAALARKGKRVTAIDLDLEAPGLSTLLAGEEDGGGDGVLDYLVEKPILQNEMKASTIIRECTDPRVVRDGQPIALLPAGDLGQDYVEKLARLDVEALVRGGRDTLSDLLREVRSAASPDVILLDCRAGLHDIGGLAVALMAHHVFVLATDNEQSRRGLRAVVRALSRPESDAPVPLRVVQALVHADNAIARQMSVSAFRNAAYAILCEQYYEPESVPAAEAIDVPHDPILLDDFAPLRTSSPWDHWNHVEVDYRRLVGAVQAVASVAGAQEEP